MRQNNTKNFVASIVGSLIVASSLFVGEKTEAMPVDPDASLPGMAPAGYPSFTFNDDKDEFGNRVQSWFAKYLSVRPTGGGFEMVDHNEGDFKLWDSGSSYVSGNSGTLDLDAIFNSAGVLQSGSITIRGVLPGLGINMITDLVTAQLTTGGFAFDGDLLGFTIDNITYAVEIVGCNPSGIESIYFYIDSNFPDFPAL